MSLFGCCKTALGGIFSALFSLLSDILFTFAVENNTIKHIMNYTHKTFGTCSQFIDIELDDNKIKKVNFIGGCHGNTQGVSILVKGMDVKEAISRLKGIRCRNKETSCPDQLALGLENALRQMEQNNNK